MTSSEQALYLIQLINDEISSGRDNYLPLYELHQLVADYVILLEDVENEKTISAISKRIM